MSKPNPITRTILTKQLQSADEHHKYTLSWQKYFPSRVRQIETDIASHEAKIEQLKSELAKETALFNDADAHIAQAQRRIDDAKRALDEFDVTQDVKQHQRKLEDRIMHLAASMSREQLDEIIKAHIVKPIE